MIIKTLVCTPSSCDLKTSMSNHGSVENEQDSNDNDRNIDIQQEGRRINYHSYMKRTLQTRWSKTDTELFYQVLYPFDKYAS